MNREEKKTELSVSSLLIKSLLWFTNAKNQLMIFSFHPSSQSSKIVLGNKVINFSDSVTYLDFKISANLSDNKEDSFRQVRSTYCTANKLKAKFLKCSFMVKNKLCCFAVVVCLFMLAISGITFVNRHTIKPKQPKMMPIEFFTIYHDLLKLCHENTCLHLSFDNCNLIIPLG